MYITVIDFEDHLVIPLIVLKVWLRLGAGWMFGGGG